MGDLASLKQRGQPPSLYAQGDRQPTATILTARQPRGTVFERIVAYAYEAGSSPTHRDNGGAEGCAVVAWPCLVHLFQTAGQPQLPTNALHGPLLSTVLQGLPITCSGFSPQEKKGIEQLILQLVCAARCAFVCVCVCVGGGLPMVFPP